MYWYQLGKMDQAEAAGTVAGWTFSLPSFALEWNGEIKNIMECSD